MKMFVYALQDPRDLVIKYVGMSSNPKQRLREHCNLYSPGNGNKSKIEWITQLKTAGLKPGLIILEDVSGAADLHQKENFYIQAFKTTIFNKQPSEFGWINRETTAREGYSQRTREEWIKDKRNKRQIEVTYPDKTIKLFTCIQDAADSLGLRRKMIDELLSGYKNKGQGKIVKVLGWRGHTIRYVPCETLSLSNQIIKQHAEQ